MATFTIRNLQSAAFDFALEDIKRLMRYHDEEIARLRKTSPSIEVFRRAAIILCITAWETFIEDTIRKVAEERIGKAKSPHDVEAAFASAAMRWHDETTRSSFKPEKLKAWTGDSWRATVLAKLKTDIDKLNTPSSKNIRELSDRYLGTDLTAAWKWKGANARSNADRLDKLITLRGALAHRGRDPLANAAVTGKQVKDAVTLLRHLVDVTEKALGTGPVIWARQSGRGSTK